MKRRSRACARSCMLTKMLSGPQLLPAARKSSTVPWRPTTIAANPLGADACGMTDQIGAIAPGLQADIIAVDGNPLKDITVVRRVVFVMKGGIVYKNAARGAIPALFGLMIIPGVPSRAARLGWWWSFQSLSWP